jgi:hypothetical protein
LGACLFYRPPRTEHKCKDGYEVLLVCTSDGHNSFSESIVVKEAQERTTFLRNK